MAEIADPAAELTGFLADVVGIYEVSLVVNDGTMNSAPDTVTITAIPPEQAVVETLEETEETIRLIPPENLHNDKAIEPLSRKIQATLKMVYEGFYEDALYKLQNDILKKTNGCAETGAPDATDWILTCEDQAEVYPLVMRAIELLQRLVN